MLTSGSLAIIAVCAGVAVFHPAFDDTLIQRVGLCGISIGALSSSAWVFSQEELPGSLVWLSLGAAIYALETARKLIKLHHANRL